MHGNLSEKLYKQHMERWCNQQIRTIFSENFDADSVEE